MGFYIPEDGILHSHRRENLKSYKVGYWLFPGFLLYATLLDRRMNLDSTSHLSGIKGKVRKEDYTDLNIVAIRGIFFRSVNSSVGLVTSLNANAYSLPFDPHSHNSVILLLNE
jgi:hypothetical protein